MIHLEDYSWKQKELETYYWIEYVESLIKIGYTMQFKQLTAIFRGPNFTGESWDTANPIRDITEMYKKLQTRGYRYYYG